MTMHAPHLIRPSALALALVSAATTAWAQPAPQDRPWTVTLGAGVTTGPDDMGSNDRRTSAVPILIASWKTGVGRFSVGDLPGAPGPFLVFTPYETDTWSVGFGFGNEAGRDDDGADHWTPGSARLKGMGDVDDTPVAGVYATWRLDSLTFTGLLRTAIDRDEGHGGRVADVRVAHALPMPDRWSADVSVGATYTDGRYLNTFFGVTSAQSAATGFRTYALERGLRDVSVSFGARHHFDAHLTALFNVSVARLASEVRDSPVVTRAVQPRLFAGVGYRF